MPGTPAHPTESVRGATKTTTTIIIVIISISRSYFCVVRTTHISFALAVKVISSFFFSGCRARFSSLSTFTRAWAPLTRFWRKLDCVLPKQLIAARTCTVQKLAFEGFFSRAANTGEETGASAIDWSTSCANSFPGSSTTRPLPLAPGNG